VITFFDKFMNQSCRIQLVSLFSRRVTQK